MEETKNNTEQPIEEERELAEEGTSEETPAQTPTAEEGTSERDAALALAKAQAEADDFKRRLYAVTAEYDNYRKRTAATASQKYAEGRADILLQILPVADNLERALAVCTDENMKKGLQMVMTSFEKVLEGEGVESFDPTGEEFDSATSTAIAALPAEEGEAEGTVKQTYLKGYKKGDKILRFAQVVVAK